MAKGIMLQGTASNVGKSVLTTALCRIFAQEGYQVAPFKSWNMALNSYVTSSGGEIGRAQAVQADAAGVEAAVNMQPMLVKPKGNGATQVIVNGKPLGDFNADRKTDEYIDWALDVIDDSLTELAQQFEMVVLEGAGSPAEINMREQDLANMKVARLHDTPVLLVADIDRGGALASVVGTLKLLPPEEKKLVKGIILNKFRGDYQLLKPGIELLEDKTGIPVVGVVPYLKGFKIPDEDSVSLADFKAEAAEVKIGVVKLSHISNFTDFEALKLEPKVEVKYLSSEDELEDCDALIIPGTKNTTADLRYLKETGLAKQIIKLATAGVQIVGICGGYQMLGTKLFDPQLTEGQQTEITGLALLDLETTFSEEKVTYQVQAEVKAKQGFFSQVTVSEVTGYEIHMGQTNLGSKASSAFKITTRFDNQVAVADGACNSEGTVWGTYLHGIFANDQFRRDWINHLRQQKGLEPLTVDYTSSREQLAASYDQLARVVENNLDLELIYDLLKRFRS